MSSSSGSAEPFAETPYPLEVRLKNDALSEFWRAAKLPGQPARLVEAASPRGYRTTSKRRVTMHGRFRVALGFTDPRAPGAAVSALDLPAHNRIYDSVHQKLSTPPFVPLARVLNWVILRGDLHRFCLILNVSSMDGKTVRKARQLAEHLAGVESDVTAASIYFDPTRSDYYLTAERPQAVVTVKHLFGPRLLTLNVDGLRLKYPPTVFSQVNEAMVPVLTRTARNLLRVSESDRLTDLYCGFGLFSFALGVDAMETIGVELEGAAIATARETAKRQFDTARFRFITARITAGALQSKLPPARKDEVVLLDPPRKGAEPGVIEAVAERAPKRVLQICCGTDEIVPTLHAWTAAGYRVQSAQPLDLFPGTASLETLILLTPSH